jgi:hypothetical protein
VILVFPVRKDLLEKHQEFNICTSGKNHECFAPVMRQSNLKSINLAASSDKLIKSKIN